RWRCASPARVPSCPGAWRRPSRRSTSSRRRAGYAWVREGLLLGARGARLDAARRGEERLARAGGQDADRRRRAGRLRDDEGAPDDAAPPVARRADLVGSDVVPEIADHRLELDAELLGVERALDLDVRLTPDDPPRY